MSPKRHLAPYLISTILATTFTSSCATKSLTPYEASKNNHLETTSPSTRNEQVFNLFAGIAKAVTSVIIYPYIGPKNLYKNLRENKDGVMGVLDGAGNLIGRPAIKFAEELTYAATNRNTNSLVEEIGPLNEKIEKEGGLVETIRNAVPLAAVTAVISGSTAAYSTLKTIPVSYLGKKAFNQTPNIKPTKINTKTSQHKTYQRNQLH